MLNFNRNFIFIVVALAALLGLGVSLGANGMVLAMVGLLAVACVVEGLAVSAASRHDAMR
jgi:hypothetical protein